MSEIFMPLYDVVPKVIVEINPVPLKTAGGELITPELLHEQGERARNHLVGIDYHKVRPTCSDERERVGLRSGAKIIEARPSILGGGDLYLNAVLELIGYTFPATDPETDEGEAHLRYSKQKLNDAGYPSGGHGHCAFAIFQVWLEVFKNNPEAIKAYGRQELGDGYDKKSMEKVIAFGQATFESQRYKSFDETVYIRVLGDEAGRAIEELADVPHEGVTFLKTEIPGMTVDQTALYKDSAIGKGSFIFDNPYANIIEHVASSAGDASNQKLLAEHAREAIIAAVANVLPNQELYGGRLRAE